jgi:hypothetical protein
MPNLIVKYTVQKIYIDGANPSFIKSLKMQWGERSDYENVPKEQKQFMKVEPVNFNQSNPGFDKLITSLRTAVAEENTLDKQSMSYADILDAYRLALKDYKFITKEVDNDIKTVTAKPKPVSMKTNTWNVTIVMSTKTGFV